MVSTAAPAFPLSWCSDASQVLASRQLLLFSQHLLPLARCDRASSTLLTKNSRPPSCSCSIAGLKLDNDVTVVAMQDGNVLPLPPNAGTRDADGNVRAAMPAASCVAYTTSSLHVHIFCVAALCVAH